MPDASLPDYLALGEGFAKTVNHPKNLADLEARYESITDTAVAFKRLVEGKVTPAMAVDMHFLRVGDAVTRIYSGLDLCGDLHKANWNLRVMAGWKRWSLRHLAEQIDKLVLIVLERTPAPSLADLPQNAGEGEI